MGNATHHIDLIVFGKLELKRASNNSRSTSSKYILGIGLQIVSEDQGDTSHDYMYMWYPELKTMLRLGPREVCDLLARCSAVLAAGASGPSHQALKPYNSALAEDCLAFATDAGRSHGPCERPSDSAPECHTHARVR